MRILVIALCLMVILEADTTKTNNPSLKETQIRTVSVQARGDDYSEEYHEDSSELEKIQEKSSIGICNSLILSIKCFHLSIFIFNSGQILR